MRSFGVGQMSWNYMNLSGIIELRIEPRYGLRRINDGEGGEFGALRVDSSVSAPFSYGLWMPIDSPD